jgi:pSer/pThr/pTyr-binding forkhead associated (FHA) protein
MTPNKSSLLSHLDTITKFVSDRLSQDQSYINIAQNLKQLSDSLKAGKLVLQILGQDSSSAQEFHKLLRADAELYDPFQIKVSTLPDIPDPNATPVATLVLQNSGTNQPERYKLIAKQSQVIGRNPSVTQILLPDRLNLVSGRHIEIKPLTDEQWQIRDLESSNGTFINGKRLKPQEWQTLKPHDQIVLGSSSQATGSAILVFEVPTKDDVHPSHVEVQNLLNSHIICLVISPQTLSEQAQRFLQLAQDSDIAKLLIIVDRSGISDIDSFNRSLDTIKKSLPQKLNSSNFELIPLILKPFAASAGATVFAPQSQPEFEQLCDDLKKFAENETESTLVKSGTRKLQKIANQIEAILVEKDTTVKDNLQQNENQLKELSVNTLKKNIDKTYRQVDERRDSFFRQVRSDLTLAKADLLNEFKQSSIFYKIQQFTKNLYPQVSDRDAFRHISLRVAKTSVKSKSSNNVHAMAVELCHDELTKWSISEWKKIQTEYFDGGFRTLLQKSHETLNFIPEVKISKSVFVSSQTLNVQSVLGFTEVEPTFELRYKQPGFIGYMLKNLRGQVIAIGGLLAMFGTSIGVADSIKPFIIPCLLPIVLALVSISHKQEKETKIHDTYEKLQRDAISHYQSYTKMLVDRLSQRINSLLDAEDKNFRDVLDNVKESYAEYVAEVDEKQRQLQSQVNEMKRSGQSKTERDLVEFQKIKQAIQSL